MSIYFAIELSLREISFVAFARANDEIIVRSRDARDHGKEKEALPLSQRERHVWE